MGSHMNFKNFGDAPSVDGYVGKPAGNHPLTRQSSVYTLTFDEFQNTLGGLGKDFGSMNMDELLKNIWTAEETQIMTSTAGGGGGSVQSGNLQRQGSITLPRTLSVKTVDEVWRDLLNEGDGVKDGGGSGGSNMPPQREPTLGEITLEEFLVRAGIVREDAQPVGRPNDGGNINNNGLTFGFQQQSRKNGLLDSGVMGTNNSAPNQHPSLPLSNGGFRSSQQPMQQLPLPPQQQQQPLFPKTANVGFASPMHLVNNAQLTNPGHRGPLVGVATEPPVSAGLVQGRRIPGGGMNMASLGGGGGGGVIVAARSPVGNRSSDVNTNSGGDTPTFSPVPYVFSRGRKANAAVEKVVERRQRRMIKNRESAARSRARKQAYTLELEAEVAKLKEMNQELQRKQVEYMEMQKNQILETMDQQWGSKRQCLRRTLTGPW